MKGTRLELSNTELARMNKLFKGKAKEINAAARVGLKRVGMNTLVDAQKGIKDNGSMATSQLFNSGRVIEQPDYTVDVAFEAIHAYWVEFGRKAGGMPPIKPILEWIKKKGIADSYSVKTHRQSKRGTDFYKAALSMAWAIAKSIAAKGTKARPFLFPAFRKNEAEMMNVLGNAIKEKL